MDEWQQNFLQSSPMFEPLIGVGERIEKLDRWPTLDELNALLSPSIRTASGAAIRFVPQDAKPRCMEEKYEARIYLNGEVQTRTENWHDLFNALVWLAFPQAKAAINAKHFEVISQGGEGNRDSVRDALTLFDESGVVVEHADESLALMLREHQWRELFWEQRKSFRERMRFVIFGHSLYEKALHPYIGFTGKGLMFKVAAADGPEQPLQDHARHLDGKLAEALAQGKSISAPGFTAVPLLGVPGWWEGNECAEFYGNTAYFRPKK